MQLDPQHWNEKRVDKLLRAMDTDHDRRVSYKEFVDFVFGHRWRKEKKVFLQTLDFKSDGARGLLPLNVADTVSVTLTLVSGKVLIENAQFPLSEKVITLKRRAEQAGGVDLGALVTQDHRVLSSYMTLGEAGLRDSICLTALVSKNGTSSRSMTLRIAVWAQGGFADQDMQLHVSESLQVHNLAVLIEDGASDRGQSGELVDLIRPPQGSSGPHREFCKCGCHVAGDLTDKGWWSPITLCYYELREMGLKNGDFLIAFLGKRGESFREHTDIGHFGHHRDTPGIDYLSKGTVAEDGGVVAQHLISQLGGWPEATFVSLPDVDLLGPCKRSLLIRHLDCQFVVQADADKLDLKLNLTRETLVRLIGEESVSSLSNLFPGCCFNEIKLRRCEAHGKCINFHTDFAKRTMQIALNGEHEYVGGRLVYVTSGGFSIPPRPPGSATFHENNILHGVTQLQGGVRYALFFLQT